MSEEKQNEQLKSLQRQKKLAQELVTEAEKLGKAESEILDLKLKVKEADRAVLNTLFEQGRMSAELAAKNLSASENASAALQRQLDIISDQNKALEDQAKLQKDIEDGVADITERWKRGPAGLLKSYAKNLSSVGKGLKRAFSLENMSGAAADSIMQSTGKAVAQVASLTAELAKSTGQGTAFNSAMSGAASGSANLGVGLAKAAEATGALSSSVTGFYRMSKTAQESMIRTTAELNSLGIASAVTAANIELSSSAFGMTKDEAVGFQTEMAALASGIGVAPAKMAQAFQQAAPQLAHYGSEGKAAFKALAETAGKAGIEVQALLGITQQFDTFRGAADAAGKLNAMLGGNLLNSTELLLATEAERVEMIQESISASGKSFDSMGRLERKAMANAAGITDMTVANKMFSESERAKAAANQDSAVSQEELQKRQAAGVSVMEKGKLMIESFALAVMPLVSILTGMMNVIMAVNDAFGGFLIPTLAAVISLHYAMNLVMTISASLKKNNILMSIWRNGVLVAYNKIKSVAIALANTEIMMTIRSTAARWANAAATWAAAAATKAYGFIASGVTTVIGFLAGALGFQAKAQTAVGVTAPAAAGGNAVLGASSAAAAIPVLALGAALFLAGLGIAAIGYSASLLVNSMTGLVRLFIDSGASIGEMAIGMLMLSGTFATLGVSLLLAAGGLALFAYTAAAFTLVLPALGAIGTAALWASLGFAAIAISMLEIAKSTVTTVSNIGSLLSSLSAISSLETGMRGLADAVEDIGDSIPALSAFTAQAALAAASVTRMSGMEAGFTAVVESANAITPTTVQNVEGIIDQAERYVEVQAELKASVFDSFLSAVGDIASSITAGSQQTASAKSGGQDIVLHLDNREFGRAVGNIVNGKMKLKKA